MLKTTLFQCYKEIYTWLLSVTKHDKNYEEANETDSVEVVFMCVFCFEPFENDAKMQEHIDKVHGN